VYHGGELPQPLGIVEDLGSQLGAVNLTPGSEYLLAKGTTHLISNRGRQKRLVRQAIGIENHSP
jgi:hypothetical protein